MPKKLPKATATHTRMGHPKVRLYDIQINDYIVVSEWAAKLKLENNHIDPKTGMGRYALASEVSKYVNVPPPQPKSVKPEKVEKQAKEEQPPFSKEVLEKDEAEKLTEKAK